MEEEITYYNHYIRLNSKNEITFYYSTAHHEYEEGDTLLTSEGGYHFEMLGETNPMLMQDGVYLFKYENGEVIRKTDIAQEIANLKEVTECKKHLADTDYVVIKVMEGVATAEDYAEVIAQRQAWRSRINELE